MSTEAFVFEVCIACRDCGRENSRQMRIRPFEENLIEKRIGCSACRNDKDHEPILMYFYNDMDRVDDDVNLSVRAFVKRIK